MRRIVRPGFRAALLSTAAALLLGTSMAAKAQDTTPIKIGIIAEQSAIAGASISNAAQMAADEINAAGGVNGRKIQLVIYDNHSSATDAVRAFQRAVGDDKVVAVVGTYISEVALALQPWASRLKVPFITTGAASTDISKRVHDDYERNKYTFHEWMTSVAIADSVCDSIHEILQPKYALKTAVIFSEDAAWTTPLDNEYKACLPKIGIKVLEEIRFSPDTNDFTPIYSRIESQKPDVIVTGTSHVGVQPVVQWAQKQVPFAMVGQTSQATSGTFWNDTNGATQGLLTQSAAAEGAAITDKTIPFMEGYAKRFGQPPSYPGFSTHDAINVLAEAIKRAGSTAGDKLVDALEQTDYVGTIGRVQFYGRDEPYTHAMKYGADFITGVTLQWQQGKQVPVWPARVATGQLQFPAFVKLPAAQ
ncbi:ABC transporter substrate-binding protein [Pseudoroseomonas wenyumeiae]|uniref:ABC transporter substrate-binding protein n=1 Tax=Teichococcus wenyumeiae TaxID=2478470 RepID=A0A3A9JMT0_9PROT|nr:ABC transporter substrate-binding protein [Pseudoroseomonas wenyumeiae]RKK05034.1 ABC transporter substrate-binding protein [Pseudoroseomonas wenyumeiae]RMI20584.1 ABC transporter substrate-binding protein [Pseudoroseomonas wenyumeiae]